MTQSCLSSDEIDRWQAGEFEASRAAAVQAHLSECQACARLLADLESQHGRLFGRLRDAARGDTALDAARAEAARPAPPVPTLAGFRMVREVSRGGQGVVFEAEQTGTKRRVAIKLLLDGAYAGPAARRRFEREIELAAGLKHPNVVAVFHAGASDDGRQFCAMDYVDGVPLNRFVRERRLALRDALALFATVCDAVQYAHQRGVIHRDLKPSNILVEADGTPRVLDFGLAKQVSRLAAPGESQPGAPLSLDGQVVGTLPYMSPEQARGQASEIDTRTDVYALGVILYELLTGKLPYPLAGTLAEVLRDIQEAAPTPPSRAWTPDAGVAWPQRRGVRRAASSSSPGRRRNTSPIDDEVETLLLRALAKERERRYQAAADLARDVRRYLAGEAIDAKRDSGLYVLRKALRRHRIAVGVVAGFMTLVSGAAVALGFMYREQVAQRERADDQRRIAEQRADETKKVAKFQAAMLSAIDLEAMGRGLKQRFREQVRASLGRAYVGEYPDRRRRTTDEVDAQMASYDQLAAAARGPDVARGVLDDHVLARASGALQREFADQPLVRAQVLDAVATTYQSIGLFDAAEAAFRAALALRERELGRHRDTASNLTNLAVALFHKGDWPAAESLATAALTMQRELFGDQHADVANTLNILGVLRERRGDLPGAGAAHREALAMRRALLGDEHLDVANSLMNLAALLHATGASADAEPLLREALALRLELLGPDHPDVTTAQNNLASLLTDRGKAGEAEPLLRAALARRRELAGDEDPRVATSLNNLANLLKARGAYAEAEEAAREALALRRRTLGDEHPSVAISLSTLAVVLRARGDLTGAERLYREALTLRRAILGDEHPDVAGTAVNLASLLADKGDYAAAEPLLREALRTQRTVLGEAHPEVALTLNNLALLLKARGEYAEAETLYREALALRRRALGDEHPLVASSLLNLGALRRATGDLDAAEPLYREALALRRKLLGDDHPEVAAAMNGLAVVLKSRRDFAAAEPLYREALALRRRTLGNDHPAVAISINNLAQLLTARGDHAEAERLFREALALFRKLHGDEHRDVALCLNNLGQVLVLRGEAPQAETYFRESLALRRKLLGAQHPDVVQSLCNLGDVLTTRGEFAAAEPLLQQADAAVAARPKMPARTKRRLLESFVRLYAAWDAAEPQRGYDARATRWRQRLAELPAASRPASRPAPPDEDAPAAEATEGGQP